MKYNVEQAAQFRSCNTGSCSCSSRHPTILCMWQDCCKNIASYLVNTRNAENMPSCSSCKELYKKLKPQWARDERILLRTFPPRF
jgi:hypothetical protein